MNIKPPRRLAAAAMSAALACASMLTAPATAADIAEDPKVAARLRAAEAWLTTTLGHESVPGASVGIIHDQDTVWAKGFGYANLSEKTPADADTLYSVCSISKLFTSIGVMQLRDQGKIDLDQPVATYLDWFDIGDIKEADEPVTARGILSHVAGLPREAATPYWTDISFPSRETVRKGLKTQDKLYRPYDYYQYSNLGMTLLGEMVEKTSGRPYDAYIRDEILTPLGMTRTTTELPNALRGREFAVGYLMRSPTGQREEAPVYALNGIAPAAGFASSVNDLAKFASWQFRLREKGGEEVLKAPTLREMQRVHWMAPEFDGAAWGLGFATRRHDGETLWGHGGYCPGYRAEFVMRLPDRLAFVVLVNVNDISPSEIAMNLYDLTRDAIIAATEDAGGQEARRSAKNNKPHDFSIYEGAYGVDGFDWDEYYAFDGETLFRIGLYTDDPAEGLEELQHVEGHVFRVRRKDGTLAQEVRFDVDEDGRVLRAWDHGNYLTRR